jgi:NADH-quinone oxidoreductase subunit C
VTADGGADVPEAAAAPALPDHPLLHGLASAFEDVSFSQVLRVDMEPQDVADVPRDQIVDFMAAAHGRGYRMFVDLCGVDYLRRHPRFDVVVNVLAIDPPHRLVVRIGVPADDPTMPSITDVYPGANFYERETFDLLGIEFTGHPDLTRILLPDDWEGHPLRKDYAVGSVPVQFKGAPRAE